MTDSSSVARVPRTALIWTAAAIAFAVGYFFLYGCASASTSSPTPSATITASHCHPLPSMPGSQEYEAQFTILNNGDTPQDFTVTWHAAHDYSSAVTIAALPAHHQTEGALDVTIPTSSGASEPVSCTLIVTLK